MSKEILSSRTAYESAQRAVTDLLAKDETYTALLKSADFPDFVAGLIKGVFDALVDSSIEQMEAYAKLVAEVSKSVDQFMKENVEPNKGRDQLTRTTRSMAERQQLLATMVLMGATK